MNKIHPELFDLRMSAEAQPLPGINTASGDTIATGLPRRAVFHFYFGASAYTALQKRKEA